jgi:hypothetical protein
VSESDGAQNEYDDGLADVGVTEEAFSASPEWAKERFAKLAAQKHSEKRRAEEAERVAASYQARLTALESQLGNQTHTPPSQPATGLDQFDTVDKLKAVAKKLLSYQQMAVDPDLTADQRRAARAELDRIEDVPGTLLDIHERIAAKRTDEMLGKDRQERDAKERTAGKQNDLARRLVVKYGQDAINKESDLSKKAVEIMQDWMADGLVDESSDTTFVALQAFEKAANGLNKNRSGRGADPRHSAVEGSGTAGKATSDSVIAALERRAQEGDRVAGKKVQKAKLGNFIQNLIQNGHISGA